MKLSEIRIRGELNVNEKDQAMNRIVQHAARVRSQSLQEAVAHGVMQAQLFHQAQSKQAPVAVRWEKFLPQQQIRVLLVEDDDSTRQVVSALLRNCSYQVSSAANGLLAWELLMAQTDQIDLVLTEVVMPSLSGTSLLARILSHEAFKHIPVIMMSSHDSMGIVFKCLSKGAVDFLVKPLRKNELKNLWQHVWRRCHISSLPSSGSGNGRQSRRIAHCDDAANSVTSASNEQSDHTGSRLHLQGGSDNGSGTQSSWIKRAVEVESSYQIKDSDSAWPDCRAPNLISGGGTSEVQPHEFKDIMLGSNMQLTAVKPNRKALNFLLKEDSLDSGDVAQEMTLDTNPRETQKTIEFIGAISSKHSSSSAFSRHISKGENALLSLPIVSAKQDCKPVDHGDYSSIHSSHVGDQMPMLIATPQPEEAAFMFDATEGGASLPLSAHTSQADDKQYSSLSPFPQGELCSSPWSAKVKEYRPLHKISGTMMQVTPLMNSIVKLPTYVGSTNHPLYFSHAHATQVRLQTERSQAHHQSHFHHHVQHHYHHHHHHHHHHEQRSHTKHPQRDEQVVSNTGAKAPTYGLSNVFIGPKQNNNVSGSTVNGSISINVSAMGSNNGHSNGQSGSAFPIGGTGESASKHENGEAGGGSSLAVVDHDQAVPAGQNHLERRVVAIMKYTQKGKARYCEEKVHNQTRKRLAEQQ